MAYRRKQGVARGSTFREEILNPSPNLNERSPASSLAAKAIRASSAHRDSSLSSAYGYGYGHSPQPTSTSPIPSSPSSSTSTSTSASTSTKDSTGYEYTSMKSLGEPKQGFWGVLARKAKAIIDDDNVAPQCESPRRTGLQMPDTARKGRYYDPYQSPESRSKTDSPPLQKGLGAIASSLNYIGGTIGNALEEGLTIVENRTADIIQETRKLQISKEIFVHLHIVAESYHDNLIEQNTMAKLGNMCLAAVQAYDTATESIEALNAAELKFKDIINSPSLDAACKKIDKLIEKNQLDSALLLMITKAWSAVKDSNKMKDEVKDILFHLYMTSRGNLQRLMPKEIMIVKCLLTIKDLEERLCALKDAFTPGEELERKDVDSLYTTLEKLHTWIKAVVDAYHFSREGTLIREARDFMNPTIIRKLEEIKKL